MTKHKHTKAPWYINRNAGKYFRVSPNKFGCNDKSQYIAEQIKIRANAHLIAAAPDGLEVAELCYIKLLKLDPLTRLNFQEELSALRNYIAKATNQDIEDVQNEYEEKART
ncbi:MAG: hypothetical protein CBC71_06390 [Rhodobacteraceae bacterium TMED111]|nr:hypothetical protein [Marinovum sp.]MAI17164.1 hypothetical protein [Marinovum sp.]OUV41073.1 MAG: hypothetical protein CBC71_06110 [Rhodobacteraceae bacterium TMED111]OUV41127.1 MAG: hypothetical protein CBC71_06390 [Rhodobacteraceae bacterium TMED111]|tara:strand:+ start:4119 stop:4451 length:333 start_codon:yes stop_codon:yes gene_type:complete